MKKAAKLIKKILKIIFIFALLGIFYSFGYSTYENIRVNQDLKKFKDRAVFEKELIFNNGKEDYKRRYYKVSRETLYEKNDIRSIFVDETSKDLGQKGDIFVTRQSPFKNVFGFHQFMTYYYGGHAAIHTGENSFIEATGYPDSFKDLINVVLDDGENKNNYQTTVNVNQTNYWTNRSKTQDKDDYYGIYYRSEFIGLRIKDIDQETIDQFVSNAYQKYEESRLYNFLFFLNMKNKYYCTDLVSRAYSEVLYPNEKHEGYAKGLNDDGFITSVNDMILAKDTYITFIFEVKKEGNEIIEYLYYLEDV